MLTSKDVQEIIQAGKMPKANSQYSDPNLRKAVELIGEYQKNIDDIKTLIEKWAAEE